MYFLYISNLANIVSKNRLWNELACKYIVQIYPDHAGSQHEESCPWQGHEEGSLTKHKEVIRLQGFPLEFPEHPLPKK